MQAYTAQRAERSANEQANENHIAEQTRQREHEQLIGQIARVNRYSSPSGRYTMQHALPLSSVDSTLTQNRMSFVAGVGGYSRR
eukprot:SAG31_NODE_36226_length_315_cov_0.949074_1_plen_83_part_01